MVANSLHTADHRTLVVACVEDHPKAIVLLRIARRRAKNMGAAWRVVFIETPSHLRQTKDGSQERMLSLFTLAEQMGGETAHIAADSLEKGIATVLEMERERAALLVIGSIDTEYSLLSRPRWNRIIRMTRNYATAVEIVPLSGQYYRGGIWSRLRRFQPHHCAYALLAVAVAYLGAWCMESLLPPALFRINDQNIALLFMTACAFVASRYGLLPGLVASIASFLTTNYFFTAPFHMLKVASVTDMLNMAIFLSAALLISVFTSQTRGYAQRIAKRELSTQALFSLYRVAADAYSRQQVLEQLQRRLTQMLEMDVAFFLPNTLNTEKIEAVHPKNPELDAVDREALNLCWKEMRTTGLASPSYPDAKWRFKLMMAPGGEIGVLGFRPHSRQQLDTWFGHLLAAITDQTAALLEHMELKLSMEATHIREEREKLRSMLLSSVSHDLKTPLASIMGALGIYRHQGKALTPKKREALIDTALAEAERLDSFITNILDMTRLESGKIVFKPQWHDMENLVQRVIKRMGHRLQQHRLLIHPYPVGVEVYADEMMTGQVVQNLLDNAGKYTAAGTCIEINFYAEEGKPFCYEIRDHGGGLPPEKLDRVFDKYARLQKKDSQIAGTGLGLAICKAIMEAQGGSITVANHPEGGAVFSVYLPQWRRVSAAQYVA